VRIKAANGLVIADPGMPLKHVMFPISSIISAVTRMQDGTDVEVTIIGRQGLYGFHLAFSSDLAHLTFGELRSRVQTTADFSEKFLAQVGKLSDAALEMYRGSSSRMFVGQRAPTIGSRPPTPVSVSNN
jgi:hypothetical protein